MTASEQITWRDVDSSNVKRVGWDRHNNLYVIFQKPLEPDQIVREVSLYAYPGVSRQRAVATAYAPSVGKYINKKIKPRFKAIKLV